MRPKINVKGEERKIKIEKDNIKAETIKDKNKNKPNRKKAFLKGVKEGEEEEGTLLNWNVKPVFSKEYKERNEKIEVDKEQSQITKRGTVKTGDFIFYVRNGEHYARISLEVEEVTLLAKAIDIAIGDIYHGIIKEVRVFSIERKDEEGKTEIIDVRTTKENRFRVYIRHGEHWAMAYLEIADASWLATVLGYEAVMEHVVISNIQQALWAEFKNQLAGKKQKKVSYDPEEMMYG